MKRQGMKGIQRIIVIVALGNMVVYIPYFLIQIGNAAVNHVQLDPIAIMPWHFIGMFLNLLALVATIRDLYLRPFADPNSKVTWCLLILCTGGIGWVVYIFKHAFQPRSQSRHETAA